MPTTARASRRWSSPSTAARTGRTDRPSTSPGRWRPATAPSRATTCSRNAAGIRSASRSQSPWRRLGSRRMSHLFLDLDGVLADFDAGAHMVLAMSPKAFEEKHGRREFWRRLAKAKDFYATLPLMPDAMKLFEAVKHLEPTILTGLPLGNWAAPQKVRWAAEHFPGT